MKETYNFCGHTFTEGEKVRVTGECSGGKIDAEGILAFNDSMWFFISNCSLLDGSGHPKYADKYDPSHGYKYSWRVDCTGGNSPWGGDSSYNDLKMSPHESISLLKKKRLLTVANITEHTA